MGRPRRRVVPGDALIRVEIRPAWAERDPPRLDLALVGIRYRGVEFSAAAHVLSLLEPLAAVASVGSAVSIDGPMLLPHDLDALDEVRDCLVRERPWPLCWGDLVAFVGSLRQIRIAVVFDAAAELAEVLLVGERESIASTDLALRELEHHEPGHGALAVDLPHEAWSVTRRPS